jgi:peptidoglycan/LPS O-acetylase OafA/YrhL
MLKNVHYMRGIAILLVVVPHLVYAASFAYAPSIKAVAHLFGDESAGVFMFVSGLLFQHLSGRYSYGDYLKKKVLNVVLPYLLMSIPAMIFIFDSSSPLPCLQDIPLPHQSTCLSTIPLPIKPLLWVLVAAQNPIPYYFIPMLAVFYLLAPALLRFDRTEHAYKWLPILLVTAIAFVPRGYNPIVNALHFLPFYLWGMCCGHFRRDVLSWTGRYWVVLVGIVLVLISAQFVLVPASYDPMRAPNPFFENVRKTAPFAKFLLCPLLLLVLQKVESDSATGRVLSFLANVSFGLFFVHLYMRDLWLSLVFHTLSDRPRLDLDLGFLLAVFGSSVLLVSIAQRLLGTRSRLLIGS